jgi:2,3-bisphosphoglycerate-independent phosphoglycerate mutase
MEGKLSIFGNKSKKPVALIILDGWGVAPVWGGNAISLAQTKTFTAIARKFPYTTLLASDGAVGLPDGAPGNSEAGHLNIGAGQVVHQDQPIIDAEIEKGTFFTNPVLLEAIAHSKQNRSQVHIMGLLSKTGTHSHIRHLFALLKLLKSQGIQSAHIHLFTDGRDSDSMSGIEMLNEVDGEIKLIGLGEISSVIGRFYAMDRDNRWERVKKAYNLLTGGIGKKYNSAGAIFTDSYAKGITDEFIEPSIIAGKEKPFRPISDGDTLFFFNFRADRAKELTNTFLDPALKQIDSRSLVKDLYFATFVMHDDSSLAKTAFFPEQITEPIGAIWSKNNLRQYHTAETEKYAHVTYFMNGGRENPFPGEDRLMIPSPKSVKTYDEMPEMSAEELTNNLLQTIKRNVHDSYIINYANTDMVGHTGNLKAAVKAVEFVDICLGRVLDEVLKRNGTAFVFADHGNVEQMVNPKTGTPDTEHTCNPVPFVIVSNEAKLQNIKLRNDGVLASVAPTVLDVMNVSYNSPPKNKSLIIR